MVVKISVRYAELFKDPPLERERISLKREHLGLILNATKFKNQKS